MKWAHEFATHFLGIVKARVREKNVTSEVESCSWATRSRGNLATYFQSCWSFTLQSMQQFHLVFRCVYYIFWPMMFTLNSMFILVTPLNKTAKPNLQVKEVLVVQAKKDTSELVKKKEEVTQVRNRGKKGTLQWQPGGVSKFPKWRQEADAIHHLRQSKPLLIRSPGVQMNPCTGMWDHRSLASGTQPKKQRPRNPRMKRSRNWRMPRSSFQRHLLRCLHFWLLMIFRLWHGLFPTTFGKIIRLIRWLYHEEIQAFPPSCQAGGKVSEAEAPRDSASHTFSLARDTSIFLIEQLE